MVPDRVESGSAGTAAQELRRQGFARPTEAAGDDDVLVSKGLAKD